MCLYGKRRNYILYFYPFTHDESVSDAITNAAREKRNLEQETGPTVVFASTDHLFVLMYTNSQFEKKNVWLNTGTRDPFLETVEMNIRRISFEISRQLR